MCWLGFFHSLITYIQMSFGSIQLEFLICGINSEYVMISRLIEIYRANTISSSIFFAKILKRQSLI